MGMLRLATKGNRTIAKKFALMQFTGEQCQFFSGRHYTVRLANTRVSFEIHRWSLASSESPDVGPDYMLGATSLTEATVLFPAKIG